VRELIALVVDELDVQGSQMVPLQAKLNEAAFFFSTDICEWLHKLRTDCSDLLVMRAAQRQAAGASPYAAEIARRSNDLVETLRDMPRRFRERTRVSPRDPPS
jgi:hypothetical protein